MRKKIEDMIFGQVKQITRQEILNVVRSEVIRILSEDRLKDTIDRLLLPTIQSHVQKMTSSLKNQDTFNDEVKYQVGQKVAELIRDKLPGAVDRAVDHVMTRLTKYSEDHS